MALRAAWPDFRHREPTGSRRQYRHRGGRARARDGHTLLLAGVPNAINATLYERLNFNFIRDIAPVAGMVDVPDVLLVNPSFPAKTIPSSSPMPRPILARSIWRRPATAVRPHLAGELFRMMTGVNMQHVPYRGAPPALTDLIAGQVQVFFGNLPASIEYVRAGTLRAMAVTTATRSEALPDVPTVGDFVPGYQSSAWLGLGVPRNTPADIVARLNKEVNAGLADPRLKARLADVGGAVLAGSPADFGKLIADETDKWGKVIQFAGLKAE